MSQCETLEDELNWAVQQTILRAIFVMMLLRSLYGQHTLPLHKT
jgi:hypothetical protein